MHFQYEPLINDFIEVNYIVLCFKCGLMKWQSQTLQNDSLSSRNVFCTTKMSIHYYEHGQNSHIEWLLFAVVVGQCRVWTRVLCKHACLSWALCQKSSIISLALQAVATGSMERADGLDLKSEQTHAECVWLYSRDSKSESEMIVTEYTVPLFSVAHGYFFSCGFNYKPVNQVN